MAMSNRVAMSNASRSRNNSYREENSRSPLTISAPVNHASGPLLVVEGSDAGTSGRSSPDVDGGVFLKVESYQEGRSRDENENPSERAKRLTREQSARLMRLRKKLKFFFLNPYEKWKVRGQFPWKLFLQVLKIVLVTTQVCFFGATRLSRISYMDETRKALSHLFFKEWDSTMDVYVYPPPAGPFSVQTKDKIYENLSHAVKRYYTIKNTAFMPLDYAYDDSTVSEDIPPFNICMSSYDSFEFFARNQSYKYSSHVTTECQSISLTQQERQEILKDVLIMKKILDARNFTLEPFKMIKLTLTFSLATVHLKRPIPSDEAECYFLHIYVNWDNKDHTGMVLQNLDMSPQYFKCTPVTGTSTAFLYTWTAGLIKILVILLDVIVFFICFFVFAAVQPCFDQRLHTQAADAGFAGKLFGNKDYNG